jgi:hypothetical protein
MMQPTLADHAVRSIVFGTTRTVLVQLVRWATSDQAGQHLVNSAACFDAACALRNAILEYAGAGSLEEPTEK